MTENEDRTPEECDGGASCGAENLMGEAGRALQEIKSGDGIWGFFNFNKMYFPIFARILLIVFVALTLLGGLLLGVGSLVAMFSQGFFHGLMLLVMTVVYVVVGLIITRIWIELVMVAFKINDNVQEIRDILRARQGGR